MGLKRTGWGVLLFGLCLLIVSGAFVLARVGPAVSDAVSGTSYPTPMNQTLSLDKGDYLVYQTEGTPPVTPSAVHIAGPGGVAISAGDPGAQEHIDRNGTTYQPRAGFSVPSDGQYQITIDVAPGSSIAITKDLVALVTASAGWFLGGFLAVLLVIAGVVMLIMAGSRRRRLERDIAVAAGVIQPGYYGGGQHGSGGPPAGPPPASPTLPRAGWYPDPEARHKYRWWNGAGWEAALPDERRPDEPPPGGHGGPGVDLTK